MSTTRRRWRPRRCTDWATPVAADMGGPGQSACDGSRRLDAWWSAVVVDGLGGFSDIGGVEFAAEPLTGEYQGRCHGRDGVGGDFIDLDLDRGDRDVAGAENWH